MKHYLKQPITYLLLSLFILLGMYSCSKDAPGLASPLQGQNATSGETEMALAQNQMAISKGTAALVPKDHLVIMQSLLKSMLQLKQSKLISEKSSGQEILSQLTKSGNVNSENKTKINEAITQNNVLYKQRVSPELQAIVREVQARTSFKNASNITQFKSLLLSVRNDPKYQKYPQVVTGLDVAYQFVSDGESTIYSAAYYKGLPGVKVGNDGQLTVMAKSIAEEDKDGAIAGAVAGAVAGVGAGGVGAGPGALGGAVAGGIGGSTVAAISNFIDWLF